MQKRANHLKHLDLHPLVETIFVKITNFVGSPLCALIFCIIAVVSLPAVLTTAFNMHVFPHWLVSVGLIALVAWIAQTFLQLVLLSVIMVGQNASAVAADTRANKTEDNTEQILDRLDARTQGGLKDILDAIEQGKCQCQSP